MAKTLRPSWRLLFAENGVQALNVVRDELPDLVIIDVALPGEDGFAVLSEVAAHHPATSAMVMSGREDAAVSLRARASSARGFIAKADTPDAIVEAIDAVLAGRLAFAARASGSGVPDLTARQLQVLLLLAEGHGNKEIRHRLNLAERTVRAHLTEIFQLLGAHSRTQALVRARELGLIA